MLLQTSEAAKILNVSKATLETWRSRGGGPVFVKYSRAVRYRKEDLDKFIVDHLLHNTTSSAENV